MRILDAVMPVAIFAAPVIALLCFAVLAVRAGRTPQARLTPMGMIFLLGALSGFVTILSQVYMHRIHGWLPGIWIVVTVLGFLVALGLVTLTLIRRRESVTPGNVQS